MLAVHVLLRPLGRLFERVPTAGDDEPGTYVLTLDVRRKHQPHVRAQLLQALSGTDITLRGLSNHTDDGDDTASTWLRAELLVDGDGSRLLDALVTRLSLEPGVRTISWRNDEHLAERQTDETSRL